MEIHALVENMVTLLIQEMISKLSAEVPAEVSDAAPGLELRFEAIEHRLLAITERTKVLEEMRDEHDALRQSMDRLSETHDACENLPEQYQTLVREMADIQSITSDYEDMGDNIRSEIRVALKRCSSLLEELENVFC